MAGITRRQLAEYAANQLVEGISHEKLAAQLAAILVDSKRANDIELLMNDVAWEMENRGEVAETRVTSANPLTEELRNELSKLVKEKTKVKYVNIQENIDKSVLGGIRIETATHSWDKTIARQLAELKESLV